LRIAILLGLILAAPPKLGNSLSFNKGPLKVDSVSVVVAALDLPRGQTITGELIKIRDFPKDLVPPGAITKPEDAIDRTVSIPVTKDEAVLDYKLTPRAPGADWLQGKTGMIGEQEPQSKSWGGITSAVPDSGHSRLVEQRHPELRAPPAVMTSLRAVPTASLTGQHRLIEA
jgi:hypothetical protein